MAFAASCTQHAPAEKLAREVFLTFDNLTGDPSFDWIAQAAPRMLDHSLAGLPDIVPLVAGSVQDGYLEGATRLVHGYFEMRSDRLHFEIDVEDAAGHKMIQTAAEDGEPVDAMNRAARILDPGARAFPASPEAVDAWGHGQYERAVTLDPDFALAWLAWVNQLASSGNGARAQEVAEQALARSALRSPIDRARLELAAAALHNDQMARIAALRKLVELVPADASPIGELAETEMNARLFTQSVHDYQTFVQAEPANASARNLLGYAQAFAGDLDGARKTFEEYGRDPGQAVNASDSLGEACFVNGKFDQAERAFLDAYQKNPSFLQGATLWKAAHARWLAGDLPEADKIMDRYAQDRAKAHDPLLTWRRANWLYETGRREQAVDLMMHVPPEAADEARKQLQVWNNPQIVPSDLTSLEKDYQRASPVNGGLVRTLYAEALFRAGRKEEARSLIKLWPLPEQTDSLLQSLLYPKFIELRKALQP